MNNIYHIYKIICKNNDKFYIGSSISIDRRLKDHKRSLNQNKHENKHLQKDWNKYGEQNFRYEIVEVIYDKRDLLAREKWWLDNTECYKREIGFNISCYPRNLNGEKRFIDLTGQKFGRLTPTKYIGKNKWGRSLFLCQCDCGGTNVVAGYKLKSGRTKSCGCINKDRLIKRNFVHGYCKRKQASKTYNIWNAMIQRCVNKTDKAYKNYGGRGITVCKRWSNKITGYKNFLKDMGECPSGLSLDRINNNKLINSYSLKNCRWTTRGEQARNRRNNHIMSYNNKDQCITDLAKEYNIGQNTLRYRLKIGLSMQEALTLPVGKGKLKTKELKGESK